MSRETFTALTEPTAAQLNIVSEQTVMVFSSTADRDSQIPAADTTDGMFCVTTDDFTMYWVTDDTDPGGGWEIFLSPTIDYVPTWNNLTIGSSTVVASYAWLPGRILHCWGQAVLAADASVTGDIQHIIPLSQTASAKGATGTALLNDVATRIYTGLVHCVPSSTVFDFHHSESANGGVVDASSPFTWATGDVFTWDIQIPVT